MTNESRVSSHEKLAASSSRALTSFEFFSVHDAIKVLNTPHEKHTYMYNSTVRGKNFAENQILVLLLNYHGNVPLVCFITPTFVVHLSTSFPDLARA